MRTAPTDADDLLRATRLGAEPWMLEALKLNPSYVHWGNHEDYMASRDAGWREAAEVETVADLWAQDEWNEVVHGYFFIDRDTDQCSSCDGSGYNPETRKITEDWYGRRNPRDRWCTSLTQDEVDALIRAGRLRELTKCIAWVDEGQWVHYDREAGGPVPYTGEIPTLTPEEVNKWAERGLNHDAINRMICVETRATRLGVYGKCPDCGGDGRIFTEGKPRLALQLWMIHPRKGAARGLIVRDVAQGDIPTVQAYFKTALDRTAGRFSKLAGM